MIGTDDFRDFESIGGGSGADSISATAATVALTLQGAGGNDTITGGIGNDTLIGGNGQDNFVLSPTGGQDTVSDFTSNKNAVLDATDDVLNLAAFFSGETITTANLGSYVTMSGNNLQLDRDGAGSAHTMTTVATLSSFTATATDLQNMLTAGQLILA